METITEYKERIRAVLDEDFFEVIYETTFPKVARYISNSGGSLEDAKDIFHDALVIYFEKMQSSETHVNSTEAYIQGISKNLWARKSKSMVDNFDYDNLVELPEDPAPDEQKLLQFLEIAGKKCLDIIHSFYYEHLPVKSIASAFGFGSEHSASVQKYKCIEKIRKVIKQKSFTYEDFFE